MSDAAEGRTVNPIGGISVCQGERCRLWVDAGAAGTVAGGDRAGRRGRAPSRARPVRTDPTGRAGRTPRATPTPTPATCLPIRSGWPRSTRITGRLSAATTARRVTVGPGSPRTAGRMGEDQGEVRLRGTGGADRNPTAAPGTARVAGGSTPRRTRRSTAATREIREAGERTIIPGILSAEAEDPTRCLAGFDNRFKGEDRLKEKVANCLSRRGTIPSTKRSTRLSDAVRLTFRYPGDLLHPGCV